MRDYTNILQTEVLPTLQEQHDSFVEIQQSTRSIFDKINGLESSLKRSEDSNEQRCRDSVQTYEVRVKQLEDDIASMIREMKEQDRRTQKFKDQCDDRIG